MARTPKQAAFVREYLVDLNGTQAAIRAGYSKKSAAKIADQLLNKPEIKAALDKAIAARAARVEVKSDDVLRELLHIARVDIGQVFDEKGNLKPLAEIPEEVRRAISGIEVDELFEGYGEDRHQIGVTKKVRFWDKPKALELLGKHLKLFTERIEHSGVLTLEQLVAGAGEPKPGEPK